MARLAGDVSDASVAQRPVDTAAAVFGTVDHVVCNAGIDIIKPAVDYRPEEWLGPDSRWRIHRRLIFESLWEAGC